MAARRGDGHRLIRWLWTSRRLDARLARAGLAPLAGLWRVGAAVRNLAYDRGWLPVHDLPLPAVAVGNLTVGGSGKTPIASWIAARYAARGFVPGILLGACGGADVLSPGTAARTPNGVPDPDPIAGPQRAGAF